jgi:hypothetical protein
LIEGDKSIDASLDKIMARFKEIEVSNFNDPEKLAFYNSLSGEIAELGYQIGLYSVAAKEAGLLKGKTEETWFDNFESINNATKQIARVADGLE